MQPFEARRIMIVDDEESIRQVCRRVLTARGHFVLTAADAASALEMMEKSAFDLVITDVMMPGAMDGMGLLKEIQKRWPALPVVLMTAYPSLESAIPALRSGALDYLIKPFDKDTLCALVTRCLKPT